MVLSASYTVFEPPFFAKKIANEDDDSTENI